MKKFYFLGAMLMLSIASMAQQPVMTLDKTTHDFGDVDPNLDNVTARFVFRNEGMEPLVISNVKPSCSCTTPGFTRTPVEPGDTGYIDLRYTVRGHAGQQINKSATITSNASNSPLRLYLKGRVLPKEAEPAQKYPIKMGELSLSRKDLDFNVVNDGVVTRTLEYANLTDHPLTIDLLVNSKDNFISAHLSNTTLEPGKVGTLEVKFSGELSNLYGPVQSNLFIVVNDKVERSDEYRIHLRAVREEDFSKLTIEQRQKAPIMELASKEIDLGVVKRGAKVTKKVQFKNLGVNPLIIRNIIMPEPQVNVVPDKATVKGGKASNLTVNVTPAADAKVTSYRRVVDVITNDPEHSHVRLTVIWKVEE